MGCQDRVHVRCIAYVCTCLFCMHNAECISTYHILIILYDIYHILIIHYDICMCVCACVRAFVSAYVYA